MIVASSSDLMRQTQVHRIPQQQVGIMGSAERATSAMVGENPGKGGGVLLAVSRTVAKTSRSHAASGWNSREKETRLYGHANGLGA